MADEFDSCSSSDDAFKESATPLSSVAEAFEDLAMALKSNENLRLGTFCDACALVSVLFSSLGIAFKFAEYEYVSKVNDLLEASKTFDTLSSILDCDVANDSVKKPGSLSRHLRRVRQGLDLIKALFENFLSSSDCSLRDAASTAYTQVCAPYHTWTIRKAVQCEGCTLLPTRATVIEAK
ncbi:uncharacterized protein A4U43_C03F15180 [Asparagus officinalis]|uniref:Glycolipid transfer protein domain-containing protein n=1 Tax=Asparagus officinalis TaxID=4686 RepID=A0A5P1FA64_ASPOF|nr:uncharacterized protein A4U43_C03F15180 [Asparagus officinalis]